MYIVVHLDLTNCGTLGEDKKKQFVKTQLEYKWTWEVLKLPPFPFPSLSVDKNATCKVYYLYLEILMKNCEKL